MTEIHVLMVEDEEAIREMLTMVLEQASFTVHAAVDAHMAAVMLEERRPDLILLDWMLPGLSGVEWAKRLKKSEAHGEIPIILLTARGEEEDKVKGLNVGADDYVTKPFSPRELVARIHAVLRRTPKFSKGGKIEMAGISLDLEQHRVNVGNAELSVSPTEFRLLEFFLTHPGRVFSRTQLLDQVWGRSTYIEERTVDVHILRLRKILAEHHRDDMIQTVRGFGYRFAESS